MPVLVTVRILISEAIPNGTCPKSSGAGVASNDTFPGNVVVVVVVGRGGRVVVVGVGGRVVDGGSVVAVVVVGSTDVPDRRPVAEIAS